MKLRLFVRYLGWFCLVGGPVAQLILILSYQRVFHSSASLSAFAGFSVLKDVVASIAVGGGLILLSNIDEKLSRSSGKES